MGNRKPSKQTKITLYKRCRGDNLYFSKIFTGFIPNISFVTFLKSKFNVQDYYFDPISNTVKIFAVDLSTDVPDDEFLKFNESGWKVENVYTFPIKNKES
jgi:hypothetical protein